MGNNLISLSENPDNFKWETQDSHFYKKLKIFKKFKKNKFWEIKKCKNLKSKNKPNTVTDYKEY